MNMDPREVSKITDRYHNKKSSLIAVLQDIQSKYNWLPPETLRVVSDNLCVPLIDIYSVATFYHSFSLTPRGKHLCTVCLGTACHVRGAPRILSEFMRTLNIKSHETTPNMKFTLETVNCFGCCAIGPVVVVDGKYHAHVSVSGIKEILKKCEAPRRKNPRKKKR